MATQEEKALKLLKELEKVWPKDWILLGCHSNMASMTVARYDPKVDDAREYEEIERIKIRNTSYD